MISQNRSSRAFGRYAHLSLLALALCAGGALGWAEGFQDTSPGSAQALVLEVGRSVMLRFEGMTRVAIVHTEVADISVVSSSELIVVADPEGKGKTGNTMLYVWDRRGLHKFAVTVIGMNPAEKMAMDLQKILGPGLNARAMSRSVVVIEGQVRDSVALRNLDSLAKASGTGEVQVVNMASAEDSGDISPAARAAEALSSMLDSRLKVTAWGDRVVVVEGEVDNTEQALQARGVISAFGEDLKVVDMIAVRGETLASQAPVAQIQRMLGEQFRVTQLRGNLVAVDGVVASQGEMERINQLLKAFESEGVQTINMVQIILPKPDLDLARSALQGALGETVIVKKIGDEALLIEGAVATQERLEQVNRVIALLGAHAPVLNLVSVIAPDKQQVLVSVKVIEINRGDTENLGIDWGQYEGTPYVDARYRPQPFLYGQIPGRGDGLHRLYYFGQQLHLLMQEQKARVLSEPNLLVNDGEEASILIGGEIPIPVASTAAGGFASVTIEYKEYGVNLRIRPTISPSGDKVILDVSPEVSSLDYGNGVTMGGLVIPGLRSRRAETRVTITDGGILAIGGLIQNDQSKAVDKIPILGDLPIIGQLFRHDTFKNNRSELIILVMPQILGENGEPEHPIPMPEGTPEDLFGANN